MEVRIAQETSTESFLLSWNSGSTAKEYEIMLCRRLVIRLLVTECMALYSKPQMENWRRNSCGRRSSFN